MCLGRTPNLSHTKMNETQKLLKRHHCEGRWRAYTGEGCGNRDELNEGGSNSNQQVDSWGRWRDWSLQRILDGTWLGDIDESPLFFGLEVCYQPYTKDIDSYNIPWTKYQICLI